MANERLYLGSFGDLLEIEPPDSLERPMEKLQSITQGATGKRTANVTAMRRRWALSWDHAPAALRTRLETLHHGLSTGPIRFIDPLTENLFDPKIASGGAAIGYAPVFGTLGAGVVQSLVAPTVPVGLNFAPRYVTQLTATGGPFTSSISRNGWSIPAKLGQVSFRFRIRCTVAGGTIAVLHKAADDFASATVATSSVAIPTPGWSWVTLTVTPNPGATALFIQVTQPADSVLELGPSKAQFGAVATDWVPGTGCPPVIFESLGEVVPFTPYSAYQLSLLEA